jgi:hypothetical protein
MHTFRRLAAVATVSAAVAVPMVGGGIAGAQDAGDCGTGGVAASSEQTNFGGLLGAILPINAQIVAPVNAPVLSPSQQTCNTNVNKVNTGGGGGGTGGGQTGVGGAGGGQTGGGGAGGGGVIGVGGAATAVVGTPRFTG